MMSISWSHQEWTSMSHQKKRGNTCKVRMMMMDHWRLNRSYWMKSLKWFVSEKFRFQIPMLILARYFCIFGSHCSCYSTKEPTNGKINEPNQWYIKCDCSENLVPVYYHCHFHHLLFTVFTLRIVIRFDFLLLFVI